MPRRDGEVESAPCPVPAQNLMTLDEFLAWEREQPERYEFADGVVVVMMTGGSLDHSTIASNPGGPRLERNFAVPRASRFGGMQR